MHTVTPAIDSPWLPTAGAPGRGLRPTSTAQTLSRAGAAPAAAERRSCSPSWQHCVGRLKLAVAGLQ